MLTPVAFEAYCASLHLSARGREKVDEIRSSQPARRVQGRAGNVCARYPSHKMGHIVQAESHTVELAGIRCAYEFDDDVLEYWDQPCRIKLAYEAKNGEATAFYYTPDFFVLRQHTLGFEEWKPMSAFAPLAERMPNRYVRSVPTQVPQVPQKSHASPDGDAPHDCSWHCPPGDAVAAEFGFYFRLRAPEEFSPNYRRNISFLEGYLNHKFDVPDEARTNTSATVSAHTTAARAIVEHVHERPGITLTELLNVFSADMIYACVAMKRVYINLDAAPLAESDQVRLFRDIETAIALGWVSGRRGSDTHGGCSQSEAIMAGTFVEWDSRAWRVVNAGAVRVTLISDECGDGSLDSRPDGCLIELPWEHIQRLVRCGSLHVPNRPTVTTVANPNPFALEQIRRASPEALRRASERTRLVEVMLADQAVPSTGSDTGHKAQHGGADQMLKTTEGMAVSERTLRAYRRQYLDAQAICGSGFVGLIDRHGHKGNHMPKLPVKTEELLNSFIVQSYETLKQKSIRQVFGEYLLTCDQQHIEPASYVTFTQRVKQRPLAEQTLKRQGRRAAYAHTPASPVFWRLEAETPRHGDYPWQLAHLDHTQLDIELVCARTGRNLGRPWLTLMIDAFSRRIPALHLSFDPPSYRACMMVMTECVRRHSCLPETLIVDNGPEFGSVYFEALLAYCHVTKLSRPTAQPRFGSLIERVFRTSESQLLHNLRGNTQIMKQVRQVTRSVNPKGQAVWTLGTLHAVLSGWANDVYEQLEHPMLGQSPCDAFVAGLAQCGARSHRHIALNDAFRMLMLPTTRKGTAKVIPGRGVKVNSLYYWCDVFRSRPVEGTQVPVRYDPFDAGKAYAYVQGAWQPCLSEHHLIFRGRSEREIAIATAEMRRTQQQHHQHFEMHAKQLAAFILSAEGQEVLLEQQLRDNEARALRESCDVAHDATHQALGETRKVQEVDVVHGGGGSPKASVAAEPSVSASAAAAQAPARDFAAVDLDVYEGFAL